MPEYEVYLCHHGIKGMKWGIRRTAAQLGHLAKSGAKRAKSAYDSHRAKKKTEREREERAEAEKKIRKTPLNKLSDDELKSRIKRLEDEKRIAQLESDIHNLRPSEQSAAKRFMKTAGSKVIGPALIDASKRVATDFLTKKGKELLGLDKTDDDPLKALKKSVEEKEQRKKLNELDKYFEREKKKQEQNNEPKNEPKNEDRVVFEGEVVGEGTSSYKPGGKKKNRNKNKKSSKNSGPIVAEGWVHETTNDATSNTALIVRGNDYIRRLLN